MHFRPRVLCGEDIKKQCDGKSTTPKGVASSLTSLPRVGCVALANPAYRKYNPDRVMTHRVVWSYECTMGKGTPRGLMEIGRSGACVPARVAPQGRIHRSIPAHNACIFGMETPLRGRSGGHIGTAPTVPFG